MDLVENFFHQLLSTLDITGGFNVRVGVGMLALSMLGEVYVLIPLLMESVWLVVGYQAGTHTSLMSVCNLVSTFLIVQTGRQIMMSAVYFLFPVINKPLSKLYQKRVQANTYYKRYIEKYQQNEYLSELRFFSIGSSVLGMLTPLNTPLKFLLVIKRKLKTLLIATLLSGMIFDTVFIVLGAVFHVTTLNVTYLPLFLLVGFLAFTLMKIKILK